jgi:hypothetical protein
VDIAVALLWISVLYYCGYGCSICIAVDIALALLWDITAALL